jgi:hypothetical protein
MLPLNLLAKPWRAFIPSSVTWPWIEGRNDSNVFLYANLIARLVLTMIPLIVSWKLACIAPPERVRCDIICDLQRESTTITVTQRTRASFWTDSMIQKCFKHIKDFVGGLLSIHKGRALPSWICEHLQRFHCTLMPNLHLLADISITHRS